MGDLMEYFSGMMFEKKKKNQTWPRATADEGKKKFRSVSSVPSCEPVWHIMTLFTSWSRWHRVIYFKNSWEIRAGICEEEFRSPWVRSV